MGSRSLDTSLKRCSVSSLSSPPPLLPLYPYGGVYYPQYAGYPVGLYGYPTYNPISYNPVLRQRIYGPPLVQDPNTRALINFQNFRVINQKFVAQTDAITMAGDTTASQVIVGTVEVSQNPLTDFLNGNDAQFKIYVQSSGTTDLTGMNVQVELAADCITAATGTAVVATVNAPLQLNGFYISGRTTGFNIDGMNGMTSLTGMRMQILDAAGTSILGCTEGALN